MKKCEFATMEHGVTYEIFKSEKTGKIKVRVSSDDWDYEDVECAMDMTDEVKLCKTIGEAYEMLTGNEW